MVAVLAFPEVAAPVSVLRPVRSQTAVVRALLEEVERLDPATSGGLSEQLVEELARLGCRILETSAELAKDPHVRR
jgi:hypothetical protein